MASAVDSRLAYARLSAVATASRLPTANRGSNNSYTTSWDTTRSDAIEAEYREVALPGASGSTLTKDSHGLHDVRVSWNAKRYPCER